MWWEVPTWYKTDIDYENHKFPVTSVLNTESEKFVHSAVVKRPVVINSSIIPDLIEFIEKLDISLSTVAYLLRLRDKIAWKFDKTAANYAQFSWYKLNSDKFEKLISPEERE